MNIFSSEKSTSNQQLNKSTYSPVNTKPKNLTPDVLHDDDNQGNPYVETQTTSVTPQTQEDTPTQHNNNNNNTDNKERPQNEDSYNNEISYTSPPERQSFASMLLGRIARMAIIISILILIIVFIIIISTGLWFHTYNVFTEEKLVAILETQELKTNQENYPYFEAVYTPVENPSALTKMLVRDSKGSTKEEIHLREDYFIHGDRIAIEAEVVNFGDWANLLGFKTIYKVTRIEGEYSDVKQAQEGRQSIYDINGGIDPVWETLEYNQEIMHPYIDGVYGSSVSQGARNAKTRWGIYITEDGLIMKKLDEQEDQEN
jgi:hypothetical protein